MHRTHRHVRHHGCDFHTAQIIGVDLHVMLVQPMADKVFLPGCTVREREGHCASDLRAGPSSSSLSLQAVRCSAILRAANESGITGLRTDARETPLLREGAVRIFLSLRVPHRISGRPALDETSLCRSWPAPGSSRRRAREQTPKARPRTSLVPAIPGGRVPRPMAGTRLVLGRPSARPGGRSSGWMTRIANRV